MGEGLGNKNHHRGPEQNVRGRHSPRIPQSTSGAGPGQKICTGNNRARTQSTSNRPQISLVQTRRRKRAVIVSALTASGVQASRSTKE